MVDRYMKGVLTLIAVCLVWLCFWGPGPKWWAVAEAAEKSSQPAGHFEVVPARTGDFGQTAWLVDTESGRVWKYTWGEGGPFWSRTGVEGLDMPLLAGRE